MDIRHDGLGFPVAGTITKGYFTDMCLSRASGHPLCEEEG